MAKWLIRGWDSTEMIYERTVSGQLSVGEVETMLQRLCCRHLTEDEVIDCSLRRNDRARKTFLDRQGRSLPISFGENPYYTAERDRSA